MKSIVKSNIFGLIGLLSTTFILIYITNHYILTISFYESNGDPVAGIPDQESQVYENLQKWIYLSSVIYLLIKLFLIALILYTALYLSEHPIQFNKIFNVVLIAEFIFFIPAIAKILWFHYQYPAGTLTDWHKVYIFSALSLFEFAPADWSYALQTLNAFEVGYWFLLAFGIYKVSGMNYDQCLRIVVLAYLPTLFISVATVTFFILMMFPNTG